MSKEHYLRFSFLRAHGRAYAFLEAALLLCVLLVASLSSSAQVFSGVSLKILNENSPPGGTIQLKLMLTEPQPITTGGAAIAYDQGPLGPVGSVALFSPTGNISGAAVVSGNHLYIRFISPNGTFGTLSDAPIIAVSISVSPSATLGAQARLTLDPTQSWWFSPLGQAYPQDVKSGTFTVAGSVAISEVDPGTGVLPAGATIVIKGFGFQPKSKVEIDGIAIVSTRFVSSSELDVVLAQPTQMYARRVLVANPDGSFATYYCYSRALQQGQSARPLLSTTLPIFARQTFSNGYFLTPAGIAVFLGLGFQNPNSPPANITLALYSRAGQMLGQTALVLPADTWISRDVSEFLPGVSPPDGSYWYVTSSAPVQMIGLIGSDATGTVVPVNPSPLP